MPSITIGAQLVPATLLDTRNVLAHLKPEEIGELDAALGDWARRPLGRDALAAAVLPTLGSVFVCLLNIDPAGLVVLSRNNHAARVHMLAVVPDMRRKGLAFSTLALALREATVRDLRWLWMYVPPDNKPATRTALACGFKRYVPQFLRRENQTWLSLLAGDVHAEPADDADLSQWVNAEASVGDAWAADLVANELHGELTATRGAASRLMRGDHMLGLAMLSRDGARTEVSLWLEKQVWGTPLELNCLKAALNTLGEMPAALDVHFGSDAHLRATYDLLKPLGFKPELKPRVLMLRDLGEPQA
jgi:GNAT superfamily N-acetyltransferase